MMIDPDPSRAFRTVAVGVLVRVLAEQDWQGDAATDVVLPGREAATDQQCEAGTDREGGESICERSHDTTRASSTFGYGSGDIETATAGMRAGL